MATLLGFYRSDPLAVALAEIESLFDDRDQNINGDCDPYLSLHRILGRAEKRFAAQVLFDPFEKQFHLPTITVQFGNGLGRQGEMVGQEDEG